MVTTLCPGILAFKTPRCLLFWHYLILPHVTLVAAGRVWQATRACWNTVHLRTVAPPFQFWFKRSPGDTAVHYRTAGTYRCAGVTACVYTYCQLPRAVSWFCTYSVVAYTVQVLPPSRAARGEHLRDVTRSYFTVRSAFWRFSGLIILYSFLSLSPSTGVHQTRLPGISRAFYRCRIACPPTAALADGAALRRMRVHHTRLLLFAARGTHRTFPPDYPPPLPHVVYRARTPPFCYWFCCVKHNDILRLLHVH